MLPEGAKAESKEERKGSSRSNTRHREPLRNLLEHSRVRYKVAREHEGEALIQKGAAREVRRRIVATKGSLPLPESRYFYISKQSTTDQKLETHI